MKSVRLLLLLLVGTCQAHSVSITVQTIPHGQTFAVDGVNYSSAQTFSWTAGSTHMLNVTSPQIVGAETCYTWVNWSDGGALAHTITTPSTPYSYTAVFGTEYYLTMVASSNWIGYSPGSGWYQKDSIITIRTYPAGPLSEFLGWTGSGNGSYTGPNSSTRIAMSGPITESALWTTCTVAVSPSSASFAHNGGSGFFSATVANNCSWTVLYKPEWIQTEYVSSGLNFTVSENTIGIARRGQIGISIGSHSASATFDVYQSSLTSFELGENVGASQLPVAFDLNQNYPNPFNPTTTIRFTLPKTSPVQLEIYNVMGQSVRVLVNEVREAGYYSQVFDAHNLASGVYFYRLQAGDFIATKSFILMR
jgi:hypothetical protein